jgi:predicted PurR-regulated permease PerM
VPQRAPRPVPGIPALDFLRNLFGNLTATVLRLVLVVGTMAAVYFFAIRPVLDTTEELGRNATQSIQQSGIQNIDEQINQALKQSRQQGNQKVDVPGASANITIARAQKLLACIQRVQPDVQKMSRCQRRFQR